MFVIKNYDTNYYHVSITIIIMQLNSEIIFNTTFICIFLITD